MYMKLSSIVLAFLLGAHSSSALSCDYASEAIVKLTLQPDTLTPSAPRAGDTVSVSVDINVNSVEHLAKYTSAVLEATLGSTTSQESLVLIDTIEIANDPNGLKSLPSPSNLKFRIPANFGGKYLLKPYVSFNGSDGHCKLQGGPARHIFNIDANPESFDLNGPEFSSMTVNSNKFVLGDTVRILVTATDKSRICTKDLIDQGTCQLHRTSIATFISPTSTGQRLSIVSQPAALERLDESHYYLDVPLVTTNPKYPMRAGIYGVDISINDEWGNRRNANPRNLTFEVVNR